MYDINTGNSFKWKQAIYKDLRTHNRINQLCSKGIWQLYKPQTRTHYKAPNVCIYSGPVVPKQAISPAASGLRSYAFNTPSYPERLNYCCHFDWAPSSPSKWITPSMFNKGPALIKDTGTHLSLKYTRVHIRSPPNIHIACSSKHNHKLSWSRTEGTRH